MPKKISALGICDFIAKYSLFALIFLLPLFFLPWTSDILNFNKQALLILLVFLSLFAAMLKILISGKLEFKKSAMHIVVGVLFFVYVLATIFSVYGQGSFWGQPQMASDGLVTVTCLALLYFLVSSSFSKKDIFSALIVLSLSAVIAQLIGVFQLFGLFILPFDFAKFTAFNTLGSAGSFALFTAVLLPVAIIMSISLKKWWRAMFVLQMVLSMMVLFLIDFGAIWWIVIIGVLALAFGIMRRKLFDGRWTALPMFFITVALFFVILNPQISGITQRVNEVFLSQRAAFDITMQAIKERPILGSGPGTFGYNFSKFKNPDFSKTALWNIVFNRPSSEILNKLATTGALGFLAFFALIAVPFFYCAKFLITKNTADIDGDNSQKTTLFLGIAAVLVAETVAMFVYSFGISLIFLYFLTVALWVGLISKKKKEYSLKPSSPAALFITFAFTLLFIFGAGLLVLNGQRYLAEVNYSVGLAKYQANQREEGLKKLEVAVILNPSSDIYFRQLSQAYVLAVQDAIESADAGSEPTDEEKARVQGLISNSINAAKIATDINPNNVNNWSFRGYVYQTLIGISGDASKWAIESYESALKLDPNSPYLFSQVGSVYLVDALNLEPGAAEEKNQLLSQAKEKLEKAVELNPSYSNGFYSLGIVYDALGQKDKAIEAFTVLQELNPQNTDIPKILETLKAGKSILREAAPPTEAPPGTENAVENLQPASEDNVGD